MRNLSGDNQERNSRSSFTETLRRQFREVMKAIAPRAAAPQPGKRRRSEDTGKAFRMAARKIIPRTARLPAEAYAAATGYLSDTLDWLNQWHHHDSGAGNDFHARQGDHLYPHL
jgi:hypothetical protein